MSRRALTLAARLLLRLLARGRLGRFWLHGSCLTTCATRLCDGLESYNHASKARKGLEKAVRGEDLYVSFAEELPPDELPDL